MQEIEVIDHRIKLLTEEKDALRRQLMKSRWSNDALRDVSRKNSGTRVMVEARVVNALKVAGCPMATARLYQEGLQASFELQENTFRTYLHRMKKRGVIESAGRGLWQLP